MTTFKDFIAENGEAPHEVVKNFRGQETVIGTYKNRQRARNVADKKDLEHGGYVHSVRPKKVQTFQSESTASPVVHPVGAKVSLKSTGDTGTVTSHDTAYTQGVTQHNVQWNEGDSSMHSGNELETVEEQKNIENDDEISEAIKHSRHLLGAGDVTKHISNLSSPNPLVRKRALSKLKKHTTAIVNTIKTIKKVY